MLAAIIPRQCLVDLAKKVHQLRVRWQIPQFCHQSDEIKGLFAQDDGFLGLQPVSSFWYGTYGYGIVRWLVYQYRDSSWSILFYSITNKFTRSLFYRNRIGLHS